MSGIIVKQHRVHSGKGWHLSIEAFIDEDMAEMIQEEAGPIVEGIELKPVEYPEGYRVAHLEGILSRGAYCNDRIAANAELEYLTSHASPFYASYNANVVTANLKSFNQTHDMFDDDPRWAYPIEGFFAIEEFSCAPGFDANRMIVRLLSELQAYAVDDAAILAFYQFHRSDGDISARLNYEDLNTHIIPVQAAIYGIRFITYYGGLPPSASVDYESILKHRAAQKEATLIFQIHSDAQTDRGLDLWYVADEPEAHVKGVPWIQSIAKETSKGQLEEAY